MALKLKWWQRRKEAGSVHAPSDPVSLLKNLQERMDGRLPKSRSESHAANGRENGAAERKSERLNPLEKIQNAVENRQAMDQNRQDEAQRERLSHIAVVAFVGPSGTGKSTRAIAVARDNHIDYLIDDGLLIRGSRIVAGTSAKRARTKIESVRQALFLDPTRAANMRRALAEHQPTTLMILGTSDSMLLKICSTLWLRSPAMLIRIEDVSTEEQRQLARRTRLTEGQHTIPVPSMEIKHEFSGYFSDPLGRLRRRLDRERGLDPFAPDSERTMVRPTFSGLGSYSMSDEALSRMIELIVTKVPGIAAMLECRLTKEAYGVLINLQLALFFGYNAQEVLGRAQTLVSKRVEEYTSINILAVNVRAIRLVQNHPSQTNGALPPVKSSSEDSGPSQQHLGMESQYA